MTSALPTLPAGPPPVYLVLADFFNCYPPLPLPSAPHTLNLCNDASRCSFLYSPPQLNSLNSKASCCHVGVLYSVWSVILLCHSGISNTCCSGLTNDVYQHCLLLGFTISKQRFDIHYKCQLVCAAAHHKYPLLLLLLLSSTTVPLSPTRCEHVPD